MLKRYFSILFLFFAISLVTQAQGSFAWGVKGGLAAAFQKWDNSDRDVLFGPHAILSIETLADEGEFGMFAQAGYHTRGSAVRVRSFPYTDPITGQERNFDGNTTKYDFKNVALSAGFKQRFSFSRGNMYYLFGLRGEYNLKNDFDRFSELPLNIQSFFPTEAGVNDFTVGFIFGGGIEIPISDYIDATIELTLNPDFTKQYYQPPYNNVYDPYTRSTRSLPERNIRNNTVELTVGFRFLRLVEYVD